MNIKWKVIFWLPRIFGVVFIFFIGLFALDVFEEKYVWYKLILAFLIHLIPSLILTIVLLIAWKRELIGFLFYLLLALIYVIITRANFPWTVYLIIDGSLITNALLFLLSYFYKKKYS